jgi:predicted membrane protein
MAQDFKRYQDSATGVTPVVVHTADSNDTVISIRLANIHASAAIVDVYVTISAVNYYIIKNGPIPYGSSLELIDGGAKIVLQTGDALTVVSDTASSLDSIVSVVDAVSA